MQNFLKQITHQAGQIVLEKFGKVGVKYTKSNESDVVTEADLAANDFLVEQITKKYPDHGIISEERGESNTKAEYVWIIDPLDGTRNFSTRTPLFAVMVSLSKNEKIHLAAIYDPVHDQMVFAEQGQGAYLNDQPIHCSQTKKWEHSYGCGITIMNSQKVPILIRLLESAYKEPFWLSAAGSAAIRSIYVADGRRDWLISIGDKIWDYAAPSLILQEAGCVVTNINGKPWNLKHESMIAANPHLHKKLLAIIKEKQ